MKKLILTLSLLAVGIVGSADDKEAAMAAGKAKFATCMACHGLDGKGMQVGPQKMAPGYDESEVVKSDNAELFALIVMKGIKKEDAKYMGMMAPLEAALDDEALAGVVTYIRNTFGGHDDFVTVEQAKEWRAKYADVKDSLTRDEIAKKLEESKK